MSFQAVAIHAAASTNLVERLADRLGVIFLLAMGLAMGGVTAFAGL